MPLALPALFVDACLPWRRAAWRCPSGTRPSSPPPPLLAFRPLLALLALAFLRAFAGTGRSASAVVTI